MPAINIMMPTTKTNRDRRHDATTECAEPGDHIDDPERDDPGPFSTQWFETG